MASEELRIHIQSTATDDGFDAAKRGFEEVDKAGENSIRQAQLFFTELRSAYQTLADVAGRAWAFMEEAAAQQGVREAFQRLAERAGMTGAEIQRAMGEAAAGTVSANQIMANANRFLVSGMQITAKQMSDLMLIARDRARAMGISVQQAFDDITVGIVRSSPLVLDNLGIIVKQGEANERLATQLGKTVEQLTATERASALLNQVLADNASGVQHLRGEQQGLSDQLAGVEANWANMTTAVGAFFSETAAGQGILQILNDGIEALGKVTLIAAAGLNNIVTYAEVMGRTGDATLAAAAAEDAFNDAMRDMLEATGQLTPLEQARSEMLGLVHDLQAGRVEFVEFARQYGELMQNITDPELVGALSRATTSLAIDPENNILQFVMDVERALENYQEPIETFTELQEEAARATEELSVAVVDNSETMKRAADRITEINSDIADALSEGADLRREHAQWLEESEDKHQQKLSEIATRGEEQRADIRRDGQDRVADIYTKARDAEVDLFHEGADSRFDIEQEYQDKLADLRNEGTDNEQEAIRRRDARSLTEARKARADDLRDVETTRERDLRDLATAEQRKVREQQAAQSRALRDQADYLNRRLRDQQTGETRAIQMAVSAFQFERQQRIAAFNTEYNDYTSQYSRLLQQRAAWARSMNGIQAQGTVTNPLTGQQVNRYDVGKYTAPVSNNRSRTALNR